MYRVAQNIAIMAVGYWHGKAHMSFKNELEFNNLMKVNQAVTVTVEDKHSNYTTFMIVSDGSLTRNAGEISKLMNHIELKGALWIVSDQDPKIRVSNEVHFRFNKPECWLLEVLKGLHCVFALYKPYKDLEDAAKNPMPSLIMSDDEVEKLMNAMHESKKNLPVILINDPNAVWSNAKVGDVIKVNRPSKLAGAVVTYYLVK